MFRLVFNVPVNFYTLVGNIMGVLKIWNVIDMVLWPEKNQI